MGNVNKAEVIWTISGIAQGPGNWQKYSANCTNQICVELKFVES